MVEVKPPEDDAWLTAEGGQVSSYRARYRLVLVGEDADGNPARLEMFRLAADAAGFERQLEKPRSFAG